MQFSQLLDENDELGASQECDLVVVIGLSHIQFLHHVAPMLSSSVEHKMVELAGTFAL